MLGRLGARAWGISSEHAATVACVALIVIVAALVVPRGRLSTLAGFVPLIVALPWVILLLASDARRLAEGKYPIGVVLLVLVLPFTQFALSGSRADVMVQGAALALAVFYFLALEPTKRASAFHRVLPVVILWLLLFGLFSALLSLRRTHLHGNRVQRGPFARGSRLHPSGCCIR